jgi:hypothetical protein
MFKVSAGTKDSDRWFSQLATLSTNNKLFSTGGELDKLSEIMLAFLVTSE